VKLNTQELKSSMQKWKKNKPVSHSRCRRKWGKEKWWWKENGTAECVLACFNVAGRVGCLIWTTSSCGSFTVQAESTRFLYVILFSSWMLMCKIS